MISFLTGIGGIFRASWAMQVTGMIVAAFLAWKANNWIVASKAEHKATRELVDATDDLADKIYEDTMEAHDRAAEPGAASKLGQLYGRARGKGNRNKKTGR